MNMDQGNPMSWPVETMVSKPKALGRERLRDEVYSNIDHRLNGDVVQKLRDGKTYAQHAAWNFCGYVWHADDCWHEEVWQYNSPVETTSHDSLEKLIEAVNEKYGWE